MEPILLALLAAAFAGLGFLLGRWRPVAGLGVFLCCLGVVSSLPWQLGLPNITVSTVFLAGLVTAALWPFSDDGHGQEGAAPAGARTVLGPHRPTFERATPAEYLRLLAGITALSLAMSGAASFLTSMPPPGMVPHTTLVEAIADMVRFDTDGRPAMARAALIAALGPALFLAGLRVMSRGSARRRIRSAVSVAIALALIGIVAQALWLDPLVRPDLNTFDGPTTTGIVGMFQDPHSLAAFLVLAIGISAGTAVGYLSQAAIPQFVLHSALTIASAVALLYTNSRGGFVAAGVAITSICSISLWRYMREHRGGAPFGTPALAGVAAVFLAAVLLAAAFASSPLPAMSRDTLRGIGAPRLAGLFDFPGGVRDTYRLRTRSWGKALHLMQQRPLLGVGPHAFVATRVQSAAELETGAIPEAQWGNAHNYYLQVGAELGIAPLIGFVGLAFSVLYIIVVQAVRSSDGSRAAVLAGIASAQIGFLGLCLIGHPLLIVELQGYFWAISGLGAAMALTVTGEQGD